MSTSVPVAVKTVIVLDDDVFVCRALKTQLEVLGYKVLIFHSGEALLASDIPHSEACLLLDVYLPRMNGIELDKRLKAMGTFLPTILMSGRDDAATKRMMRSSKPAARLFKPFDSVALEHALLKAAQHGKMKR